MPEGDTVWRTARALDKALAGSRILGSDFRVPQLAETDLTGQLVHDTVSRGKHLFTRIGDDLTIHSHLKMEGSWHLYRPETRWRRPTHEARVVLLTPRWIAVGFSLGVLELLPRDQEEKAVAHLGPDLLGPDWDLAAAVHRLAADPDRTIGEALLDQRNLAGIGNLYAAEVCFLSGVHPRTPVGRVAALPRLVERARAVLSANRHRSTQSTTGTTRRGQQHWVYRRDGQPCLRCGTVVESAMLGPAGRERATYWCPACQPEQS